LLSLCEQAVKLGEKLGASEVEAYATIDSIREVNFTNRIESTRTSSFTGLGVRLALGKKLGLHSTSQLKKEEVEKAVEKALAIAKVSNPDPDWVSLPTKYGKASVEQVFDKNIVELELSTLPEKAIEVMETVQNFDKRTTVTRGSIAVGEERVAVSNCYHRYLEQKGTFASSHVTVKAEDAWNRGQSSESHQVRTWNEMKFPKLSMDASERAVRMMDAKPIRSGKITVVLRNKLFADILRTMFGRTLSADSVQKKRSPWVGKRGKQIASEDFNLFDDGVKKAGVGTREFDDEGYPQQKTPLITNGVLERYLYDNYTANKDGKTSTGNASRSYRSIPIPVPNNLTLKRGEAKLDELVEDSSHGLYVYEVIGEWLSNPISGNLSATVTNGHLIEKGELTQAVKGVIISANFFTTINKKTNLIADDTENSGSTYSPSIRIQDINIAGT